MLSSFSGKGLNFQGLLACSLVLAGLGVLNDVTITQASSVWELRAAAPQASRRQVFAGAMRIGRDHIASTIYTIVFAYAGAALVVLMLLYVYDRPPLGPGVRPSRWPRRSSAPSPARSGWSWRCR